MTPAQTRSIGRGILVALTTPFDARYEVDPVAWIEQARWLADRSIDGVVVGGSLGEGATLSIDERVALVSALAAEFGERLALVAAVGAARTSEAVELARRVERAGAHGLLVLPPYVYRGDPTEVAEHLRAVFRATDLPCMLYNNPPAYGTDVLPDQVLALAEEHPQLTAVKESSGDVRRVSALRALLGDRLEIAIGVDDAILEGVAAGATGWVAGLANALPAESRALFDWSRGGDLARARELYRWFLPLLRMDAAPRFVQLIKLVQSELGRGSTRVRPPRLELAGPELATATETIRRAIEARPGIGSAPS